jgi:putative DNA primase/helicase
VSAADGRTTIAAGLYVLKHPALIEELARVAEWQAWDSRSKDWKRINPPSSVAAILAARVGQWRLRSISGVITCPTLRPDGSILSTPGYDPLARLYYLPDPTFDMPAQVARPSRADANTALKLLTDLLVGFPFVDASDKAVALSLIISGVVRGALGVVPVHAFTAPTPGTGKSYIADVTSAIVSGRFCPVITPGRTEEELEKRLGAMLLAGYPIIALDNISNGLGGDALCQVAERPTVRVRILGKSETPECEFRGIIIANGNNLAVIGDMTRRVILGKLDARLERPEDRQFPFDPVKRILAERGLYVAAAMTIVRAYLAAGQPDKLSPPASYAAWSDMVRSALVWLGCGDPIETMKETRDSDPVLTALRTILECWRSVFGDDSRTAQQVAAKLVTFDPTTREGEKLNALRTALAPVAEVRNVIDATRLGYWLRSSKGRPTGGWKFVVAGKPHGTTAWRIAAEGAETELRQGGDG